MIQLEWWWVLILAPAPWLVRRWLAPAARSGAALYLPFMHRQRVVEELSIDRSDRIARFCLWAFWLCLLMAAGRPFWLGEPVDRTETGRDLMLAVDISGSMSEADMKINARTASRIDVLKIVVEKFIERRAGDRIGLILFGTNAYTYVPLTFDLETLKTLLRDISTGLAGRHTAIGDAIGLSVKTMRSQQAQHKVLILVTDGSNTSGFEDPVRAARVAAGQGMTIYTIGVGSDAESLSRTYGASSIPAGTAMNETVLRQIAAVTDGSYFRAVNTRALEAIYDELDKLEPIEYAYLSHRPRHELFVYPLVTGLGVMLGFVLWSLTYSVRMGARQ